MVEVRVHNAARVQDDNHGAKRLAQQLQIRSLVIGEIVVARLSVSDTVGAFAGVARQDVNGQIGICRRRLNRRRIVCGLIVHRAAPHTVAAGQILRRFLERCEEVLVHNIVTGFFKALQDGDVRAFPQIHIAGAGAALDGGIGTRTVERDFRAAVAGNGQHTGRVIQQHHAFHSGVLRNLRVRRLAFPPALRVRRRAFARIHRRFIGGESGNGLKRGLVVSLRSRLKRGFAGRACGRLSHRFVGKFFHAFSH